MLTPQIASSSANKISKAIDNADRIVIITHENPDGDAIGSSLGMYFFLQALEKEVDVIAPNKIPYYLEKLEGIGRIIVASDKEEQAKQLIGSAQLIFCLDFNATHRIGKTLQPILEAASARKIMIDHHPAPQNFCQISISHPESSSTGELVFRLICRLGYFDELPKAAAEAILVAIMTDTGCFSYNVDNPELWFVIYQLMQKGVVKSKLHQQLFNNRSADGVQLNGYALGEKMELIEDNHVAIISLTSADLERFNYQEGDTEGLVNEPLSIHGVYYSIFLRESTDRIRISFRSRCNRVINTLAADHFAGGGHAQAAGGFFIGTMEEAITQVKSVITQYIKQ